MAQEMKNEDDSLEGDVNTSSGVKLTAEQHKAVAAEVEIITKEIGERVELVKNDETGLEALKYAMDLTSTKTKTSSKGGHNSDESDEKVNTHDSDLFDEIFKGLKDFAKKLLDWASNFIKALKGSSLKIETKKRIGVQCRSYKDLLEETVNTLQAYRLHTENLQIFINSFAKLIVPPVKVLTKLKDVSKSERSEKLNSFASKNKDKVASKLKDLQLLIDKQVAHGKQIEDLQKSWAKMSKGFQDLGLAVSKEAEKQEKEKEMEKKMKEGKKSSGIFGWLTGVVSTVVSFGRKVVNKVIEFAKNPIGGIVSVGIEFVKDIASGKSFKDALLNGISAFLPLEFRSKIANAQTDAIKQVQNGLKQIALVADKVETLLQKLYSTSMELQEKLKRIESAEETAQNVFADEDEDAYDGIETLYAVLYGVVQQLDLLIVAIKNAEQVCEQQLVAYTDQIYKPLLDLYG